MVFETIKHMVLGINWDLVVYHSISMSVAFLLALPIAWNREAVARSAGLRTFPLVSIATCGFTLLTIDTFQTGEAQARVLQGIVTGIGFIGGGAILKRQHHVSGTATAASIWATGAIGISVALKRLEIGIVLSIITFSTLQFLYKAKSLVGPNQSLDQDGD